MSHDFAAPLPSLAPGSAHAGFVVERAEALPEIGGCAYVFRHAASGARAMWLACPDPNKAFAIAFKTPPANDTGVFHILEHSVLCGSNKYPVKEPFVHLLKSSMQTFLNALTFPDKTMYPVASTNDRDLENLMDVYLDAVLHPAIYGRPRIFEQEGWHLEPAGGAPAGAHGAEGPAEANAAGAKAAAPAGDAPAAGTPADAAAAAPPSLAYNGVVYNEMKGALSSPDEILVNGVMRALFGATPYGWVSGGDPTAIPTLSYEEFLDTHARHYQLSNSYTILYGKLDIEEKLAFLNERFCTAENRRAGAPNPLAPCPPVNPEPLRIPMATTPDNACCAVAYVFASASERTRVLAADVLIDALMGSNEAPLKRAVLESGLGRDVMGFLYDGILQPTLVFELKGSKPGVAEEFRALVEGECARLAREGLGADNLEASLAQAEFNLREADFGYPDGVALAIQAMSGWLYDDEAATSYLRYEDALAELREGLGQGLFERLLNEAVCQSEHSCCVELVPTQDEGPSEEARRLAGLAAGMSGSQLASIAAEAEALHAEQAAPDTPEALATLPRLALSDIGEGPAEPQTRELETAIPCYHHLIDTHGILYAYFYFDLSCVAASELPYVSILAGLLGKLATRERSALELDTICESKLGQLSFFCEVYGKDTDPTSARPKLVVGASALSSNVGWLATLPAEVWSSTVFDDRQRIRDILEQRRIGMEMAFVESGHAAALSRVSAQLTASAATSELLGGVDFYRFLRELLDNFDERAGALIATLGELAARIFSAKGCEVGLTGAGDDVERFWETAGDLSLGPAPDGQARFEIAPLARRAEAFVVPANVCFVAEGMAGRPHGVRASGAWRVASQALSFDYLWNEVRVLGGAYGCGFRCTMSSLLELYSYRDPAVLPTLRRFENAAEWLAGWNPSPEELEGFIVATVSGMDAPVKPRSKGRALDATRLSGRDPGWRARRRAEMLATSLDELHALAEPLRALGGERALCVFGGREQIEAARAELDLAVTELFSAE